MKERGKLPPKIAELSRRHFTICLMIPLIVASVILALLYLATYLEKIKERQVLMARFGSTMFTEYLDVARQILRNACENCGSENSKSYTRIYEVLKLQPVLNNLFVVDNKGNIVQVFPRYNTRVVVYPGIQFFESKDIGEGSYIFSPPFYSIYSGTVTVSLATRYDETHIIIGELNLDFISKLNLRRCTPENTFFFITDKYGNIIAHPDISHVEKQENIGNEKWFKKAIDKTSYSVISRYQNKYYIIGWVDQPDTGWKFIIATELLHLVQPVLKKSVIILVILVLFYLAISVYTQTWISRNIILPLEEIGIIVQKAGADPDAITGTVLQLSHKTAPFKELEDFRQSFLDALSRILSQEATIRESERKFRSLTENAPVGIFIFQDDHLIYTNRMVEIMTGYTKDELNRKIIWQLVHPDYREIPMKLIKIRQSKISPPKYYDSLPLVTKQGDIRWVKLSVGSIKVAGRPAGLGIAVDITEKKIAEMEKEEYQKKFQYMQRMEAVGILAGGIAHEFNNLLQGIGLNIEMLKLKLEKLHNSSEFLNYVDNLEHLKSRASLLVESLLTFSRRKKSTRKLISVHQEIECVLNLFAETFPRTIHIKRYLDAEKDTVYAQEGQIEQIILNLITNARDAIGDNEGEITVKTDIIDVTRPVSYKLKAKGKYLRIQVTDTGVGMPDDVVNKIFDPFFTTKEVGRGTGLGLSVVLGVVESIGGSIFCESVLGRGTSFTVLLPLADVDDSAVETVAEDDDMTSEVRSEKRRVMIVDDEEMLVSIIKEFFERQGHGVVAFTTPEEAIEFLKNHECDRLDFIILDLGLPGMGGLRCLEEIRKICNEIPVVIISGYVDHDVMKNPDKYGIRFCLSKPFSITDLAEIMNRLTG